MTLFLGVCCNGADTGSEAVILSVTEKGEQIAARIMQPYPQKVQAALGQAWAADLPALGELHTALGRVMVETAQAALHALKPQPANVAAAVCHGLTLPGGLALGNLTALAEMKIPVLVAASGPEGALDCARQAARSWMASPDFTISPGELETGLGPTESRNPHTMDLDTLPTLEMLRRINAEDARVPSALAYALPQIAEAVDRTAERMRSGGRLIYAGAGTSGRLGALDASEIPPTYGMDPDRVVPIMAGRAQALQNSVEGAEDDFTAGVQAMVDLAVVPLDSVVGLAASGRTPFVLGALEEARRRGALTISIACNSPAPIEEAADIPIALVVGPEVVTGSTRMKAGTAQKLALNMLSTGIMVRLGKTFGNLMVDVRTTNTKLRARARRIVAQAAGLDEETAGRALEASGGEVKTAIVAALGGIHPELARERLERCGGIVRAALDLEKNG